MYTRLGEERLKNGTRMEVGVVLGPDADWAPRIAPFLGHKGPDYRAHLQRALTGELDALQTRFYVGVVDDRLVSQIMIVGDRGVGILGHVFTHPEARRQGACTAVMRRQVEDCRAQGFRVLCLGTTFDSPQSWIYHSYGFRSVGPGNGCMQWAVEPGAEEELFRKPCVTVRDVQWDDWVYFELLTLLPLLPEEELPRSPTLGIKAQGSAEGPFVALQLRRERESAVQAKVLVAEGGATAGWAILAPDPRWFREVWLLEVYTHPDFVDHCGLLLDSLRWPAAPVVAYLTEPRGPRAAALVGAGFDVAAELDHWLVRDDGSAGLTIWRRG